jgi:hypothetical protein
MHRSLRWLLATVGAVIGVGGAVATATATASPTHGTVHVWVTPGKGAVDQILITGIIADHGSATSIDKNGKVNKNGTYVKVVLHNGSFEVNAVAFNKALNKLHPAADKQTCSFWATGSGDITLFDGTGAYAGISGKVRMTTSFAIVARRYTTGAKKGQCNGNGAPLSQFTGQITGVGSVSL